MPLVEEFVDDTTVFSSKESTIHKILRLTDEQITWCRMKFKPKSLEVFS